MLFKKKKFPVFRQVDKMDCGPTCIRMIAAFFGKLYSQEELAEKCKVGRDGVSIYDLAKGAEQIGFDTLPLRTPYSQLEAHIPLPCIAYLNTDHFVVVTKIGEEIITLADPRSGIVQYPKDIFVKRWIEPGNDEGIILVLTPSSNFQKQVVTGKTQKAFGLSYIYSHLKSNWKSLFYLAILLVAASALQLVFPLLTQAIVDKGIQKKDLNIIYLILLAQLALVLGRTTVDFGRRWILMHISNRINISIISSFLDNLMRLTVPFFDQRMTGDILRRIDDNSRVERFLTGTAFSIIFATINLILYSCLLATYNLSVLFTFIAGSVFYMVYITQFMKRRKRLDYMKFSRAAKSESDVIELIDGIRDIKINNSRNRMTAIWKTAQLELFKITMSFSRLQQLQDGGGAMINELKNVLITFLAAQAVISGSMTLGMMLAMQYVIGQLHSPIAEFLNFTREYQEAKISHERIEAIHNSEKEETLENKSPLSKQTISNIELTDVNFSYMDSNSRLALENINVCFSAGQVTAIVGESGSGKTTLLNLLLKFYKPSSGIIEINGNDLSTINIEAWRDRCGVVMQNGYIFSDTIARNIALSSDEIDATRLSTAVEIANLKDVLTTIPNGINAIVGREGQGLSAGQKQRILIARAVYKNPEILFFDEATSSLDATNEKIIMRNVMNSIKGKTAIIVAHRLSTVINADKILVLEHGKVKEVGNHKSLIDQKGTYYNLIKDQLELGQ